MNERETYLGNGLYDSFDGRQFWLRAPRGDVDHVVALEPEVFNALIAYRTKILISILESQNDLRTAPKE